MINFIKETLGTFIFLVALIILCFVAGMIIDLLAAFFLKIGGLIFMVIALLIITSMLLTLMNR